MDTCVTGHMSHVAPNITDVISNWNKQVACVLLPADAAKATTNQGRR